MQMHSHSSLFASLEIKPSPEEKALMYLVPQLAYSDFCRYNLL